MLRARSVWLLLVAIAVLGPAAGPAAAKAPAKKKKAPLTATVNGTFTIRADVGGFGNDNGPNWQTISYEIKDAKIPFRAGVTDSAAAKVKVHVTYEAMAHTDDRSYHFGCDIEDRHSNGVVTGDVFVGVKESSYLQTDGKSKKFLGWTVTPSLPVDMVVVSSGFYQDWDSILMETCTTYGVATPLGSWSVGFAEPDGVGRINSERRSVLLNAIDTNSGQTGSAKGTIKFSATMPR